MKARSALFFCYAVAFSCLLPISSSFGHGSGGFTGGGSHGFSGQHGGNAFGPGPASGHHGFHTFAHDHRFAHDHHFAHDHFFHHRHHFFVGFDLFAFGYPYGWYDYYDYPYDYAYADPVYDYRYWSGVATAVQNELALRGYYHGSINGVIGPETSQSIRAFQKAHGLPATGLIDPALLKALKLPAVPRYA